MIFSEVDMRFYNLSFLIASVFLPINSWAVTWGTVMDTPQTVTENIMLAQPYSEILSVTQDGLLDKSNQIKIVFKSPLPNTIRVTDYKLHFKLNDNSRYITAVTDCLKLNEPCSLVDLSPSDVSTLLNGSKAGNAQMKLSLLNDDLNFTKDTSYTLEFRSNKTNGFIPLSNENYALEIERRNACLASMNELKWDLGKIVPGSINRKPFAVKIGATGDTAGELKFSSHQLENGVLTMKDGKKTGPSILFPESRNWKKCKDGNTQSVCILHTADQASPYYLEIDSLYAEPGKYTSTLTSTLECT